jgi:hypothetical protein
MEAHVTRAEDLVARVRAEPPGRGWTAEGATEADLMALQSDVSVPLPPDLIALLRLSDGLGVARPTGFFLASVVGLRRFAFDDLYDHDFPGCLPVADDGATGTYLVDIAGALGIVADVLLTNRGSLLPRDTVRAGSTLLEVLESVLDGEDLWQRPRIGR